MLMTEDAHLVDGDRLWILQQRVQTVVDKGHKLLVGPLQHLGMAHTANEEGKGLASLRSTTGKAGRGEENAQHVFFLFRRDERAEGLVVMVLHIAQTHTNLNDGRIDQVGNLVHLLLLHKGKHRRQRVGATCGDHLLCRHAMHVAGLVGIGHLKASFGQRTYGGIADVEVVGQQRRVERGGLGL